MVFYFRQLLKVYFLRRTFWLILTFTQYIVLMVKGLILYVSWLSGARVSALYRIHFQPAGYTHPGFVGTQYFMFQFAAFKENTFPVFGGYVLQLIGMMNT